MNKGQITDLTIYIKPSSNLVNFIKSLKINDDIPVGLLNIIYKNPVNKKRESTEHRYFLKEEDNNFLQSLNLNDKIIGNLPINSVKTENEKLLNLNDLYYLYDYIRQNNKKIYLHELLEGSELILPKNAKIPRNKELEERCKKLRATQQNKEYSKMTKNVDNVRKNYPEDTIAFQLQQMNRHLIAVFQFIMSVLAGFFFGFLGIELIIGPFDFGFRLLLGIICALIIALAELYFLAKKLNEDFIIENTKNIKLD